jgi:hypothetical protein
MGHIEWFTPVISATWEVEMGRSQFKANLSKKLVRAYLTEQANLQFTPVNPAMEEP